MEESERYIQTKYKQVVQNFEVSDCAPLTYYLLLVCNYFCVGYIVHDSLNSSNTG